MPMVRFELTIPRSSV